MRRANESFKRVTTSFHNSVYHIFVYYKGDITQISKIVVFNSKGKILKPEKTPLEILYAPFLFSALEIRSWKEKGKSLKGEYFFKQERNYARFEKDFDQIAWEMEKIAKKLEHALEINTAAINIASFVSSVYSFYAKLGPIAMKQILKEVLKKALQSASEETLMNLLKEKMRQEVIKKVKDISASLKKISKLFDT